MLRCLVRMVAHAARIYDWVVQTSKRIQLGCRCFTMTLTMFMSFTGYLLPWDQLAIWAVTVGSNMARAHPFIGHEGPGASLLAIGDINLVHIGSDVRFALIGGRFVGEATLLRFYVIHCIAVPFIMMIFMAVHFWRFVKMVGFQAPFKVKILC